VQKSVWNEVVTRRELGQQQPTALLFIDLPPKNAPDDKDVPSNRSINGPQEPLLQLKQFIFHSKQYLKLNNFVFQNCHKPPNLAKKNS